MSQYRIDVVEKSGGLRLVQSTQQGIETNSNVIKLRPAGHGQVMYTALSEQKPQFTVTTEALKTLLNTSSNGLSCNGGSLTDVDMFGKIMTSADSDARASTTHQRFRMAECYLYWTAISLSHRQPATANVVIVARYDGSNKPILRAGSLALPGNLSTEAPFGVGPWEINGTDLGEIQDVTINNNVALFQQGGKSVTWDTIVAFKQTEISVDITTLDPVMWATLGDVEGVALNGSTGLTGYGRAFKIDDDYEANNASKHLKFVGAYGLAVPTNQSGSTEELVTDQMTVHLRSNDDTSNPITVTVDQQIT